MFFRPWHRQRTLGTSRIRPGGRSGQLLGRSSVFVTGRSADPGCGTNRHRGPGYRRRSLGYGLRRRLAGISVPGGQTAGSCCGERRPAPGQLDVFARGTRQPYNDAICRGLVGGQLGLSGAVSSGPAAVLWAPRSDRRVRSWHQSSDLPLAAFETLGESGRASANVSRAGITGKIPGMGITRAYQFLPSTWNESVQGVGYPQYANGRADLAPSYVQDPQRPFGSRSAPAGHPGQYLARLRRVTAAPDLLVPAEHPLGASARSRALRHCPGSGGRGPPPLGALRFIGEALRAGRLLRCAVLRRATSRSRSSRERIAGFLIMK